MEGWSSGGMGDVAYVALWHVAQAVEEMPGRRLLESGSGVHQGA